MLSDDAVEDGACLARNSLFTLVLKTNYIDQVGITPIGDRLKGHVHNEFQQYCFLVFSRLYYIILTDIKLFQYMFYNSIVFITEIMLLVKALETIPKSFLSRRVL